MSSTYHSSKMYFLEVIVGVKTTLNKGNCGCYLFFMCSNLHQKIDSNKIYILNLQCYIIDEDSTSKLESPCLSRRLKTRGNTICVPLVFMEII